METKEKKGKGYVAALFDDMDAADAAVAELEREHFPKEKIGMALPKGTHSTMTSEKTTGDPATRGAATIGAPGAGYPGWTMGMAPWAFPGVGPVVVLGSMARARRDDQPDDLRTFIVSLGLHEDVFGHLEAGLKRGSILVGVEAAGNEAIARNILERNGAHILRRRNIQNEGALSEGGEDG